MKNDRAAVIAGYPLKTVRDLLRRLSCDTANASWFALRLKISEEDARRVIASLLEAGFLELANNDPEKPAYRVSRTGVTLAAAVLTKRLDRAKAKTIVAALLDRADTINADPDLTHRIAAIEAFGSYVTDTNDIGDIDIVVTLEFKKEKGDIVAASISRWRATGPSNLSYVEKACFGQIEVTRKLRARNPYIGIADRTSLDDGVRLVRIYPRQETCRNT